MLVKIIGKETEGDQKNKADVCYSRIGRKDEFFKM